MRRPAGCLWGILFLIVPLALQQQAQAAALDVVVYCDPTLAPATRAVGSLFTSGGQAWVDVFSAPSSPMLAQRARQVQNDELVTEAACMDRSDVAGLIRVPTKLGFKNPKFVTTIFVTNLRPPGFWTDRGYNWFSGL